LASGVSSFTLHSSWTRGLTAVTVSKAVAEAAVTTIGLDDFLELTAMLKRKFGYIYFRTNKNIIISEIIYKIFWRNLNFASTVVGIKTF
jgi:hypothetical protein